MDGKYGGFSKVELRKPSRSTFDLSHEVRMSTRFGKLTPVFISEAIPNDTFYGSSEILLKAAPMLAPIMHRVNMYVHYFFVPNRLLWEDWEEFITGGRLGDAVTTPPVPPRFNIASTLGVGQSYLDTGSLFDYLGGRPIADSDVANWETETIDAMPFAAYYKIWEDYYRDRNYDAELGQLPLPSGGLANSAGNNQLLRTYFRCWEHDYFTSALPFTQRGAEVLMPLVGTGSVNYLDISNWYKSTGADPAAGAGTFGPPNFFRDSANDNTRVENIESVEITGSEVSVNDLRRAVRLQEWLERNALAGSRYNESIMAHFARRTSDARLQRAEYLGGGKAILKIGEVMTTAFSTPDAETVPPASMYGKGEGYGNTNKFSYNCEEHGFVLGILSIMPTSGYMQGLPRMFQARNTFLEYPWPSFAHLGEQEVYDYEVFQEPGTMPGDRTTATVFGYQSRYADWKYMSSRAAGDFRESLDFWHLTRKFESLPLLGGTFVTYEDELSDRVFSVSDVDHAWLYVHNNVSVKRSLPYFGTPNL